jgi:hypothetical protein
MRKPDFFIVGAPKSGTTSMYFYLKQHPEIFMPERKELHFFGSDFFAPHFVRDLKEYLKFFEGADNKKRIGEASVWYLYSKRAAFEIKEFNPDADIIIMLRNPVDMMYSLHSQQVFNGSQDIINFEEALRHEEDLKKRPFKGGFIERFFYREVAKYYNQVKRYLDVFGEEKVHIIIYDDFKAHTDIVYKDTLRFLRVDETFRPDFKVINPNKIVRSRWLRDFLNEPPLIIRGLIRLIFPKSLRTAIRDNLYRLNIKYVPREPMRPELRKALLQEFKEEINRLSELIGRDLSFWYKID